ncbi:hypothetical protein FKM82_006607, partial [Ascaphus truei]
SREESRKQALAAKREKRKEKRKKKKEEQKKKLEDDDEEDEEEEEKPLEIFDLQDEEENDIEVEEDVPIEPPSATTTTTIGISATSATFTNVFGKKRANVVTTPSTNRKNKKNKTKDTSPNNMQIIMQDQHMSLALQKADTNKINGEPRGGGASGNSDSDTLDNNDCNSESSTSDKGHELSCSSDLSSSGEHLYASLLLHHHEEKTSMSTSKIPTRLENEVHHSPLSSYKTFSGPIASPIGKLNLSSPKRGQKREDGWKEVVRRSKKLSVPASVVSRIMGRGGCNITAIQDVTGAHIDVDKQKDKNGERMITIRRIAIDGTSTSSSMVSGLCGSCSGTGSRTNIGSSAFGDSSTGPGSRRSIWAHGPSTTSTAEVGGPATALATGVETSGVSFLTGSAVGGFRLYH